MKIMVIEHCNQCPKLSRWEHYHDEMHYNCSATGIEPNDKNCSFGSVGFLGHDLCDIKIEIPDWCPLDSKEEK